MVSKALLNAYKSFEIMNGMGCIDSLKHSHVITYHPSNCRVFRSTTSFPPAEKSTQSLEDDFDLALERAFELEIKVRLGSSKAESLAISQHAKQRSTSPTAVCSDTAEIEYSSATSMSQSMRTARMK